MARMRTRTSPSRGTGSGTSVMRRTSGAPYRVRTTAFTCVTYSSPFVHERLACRGVCRRGQGTGDRAQVGVRPMQVPTRKHHLSPVPCDLSPTQVMRSIAIVGSGIAGLVAAHALRRAGQDVTIYTDRSAEQWLHESRPTGTAARFDDALSFERQLGL